MQQLFYGKIWPLVWYSSTVALLQEEQAGKTYPTAVNCQRYLGFLDCYPSKQLLNMTHNLTNFADKNNFALNLFSVLGNYYWQMLNCDALSFKNNCYINKLMLELKIVSSVNLNCFQKWRNINVAQSMNFKLSSFKKLLDQSFRISHNQDQNKIPVNPSECLFSLEEITWKIFGVLVLKNGILFT